MCKILAFVCLITSSSADTNNINYITVNERIDLISNDLQQNYFLPLKANNAVTLTGRVIIDVQTKLSRTYSVLHIDF